MFRREYHRKGTIAAPAKPAKPAVPAYETLVRRYYHDPVNFVYELLDGIPDEWQARVMEDVANGERGVSIRSGHGVGKSTVLAWLLIWFLFTRYPAKGVLTAPTSSQLYDALYAELKSWLQKLPPYLGILFESKADRVELRASPAEGFITARTSRAEQPEALQGIHAAHVMLVVDEASGVPEQVFEAGTGSMSGENAVTLMAGNPLRTSGYFYESQTRLAHRWKVYHVSCLTSSRVSRRWIEEQKEKYGEDSNVYRVRVLGEFPLSDDNTIIGMDVVAAASTRDVQVSALTRPVWSLDVARFGDDASVLSVRRGPELVRQQQRRKIDLMQLTGWVKAEYDAAPAGDKPRVILVDAIGVGAGVVDRLMELGLPVRGVNVSESPAVGERYRNLRAELWFKMKAWFDARACSIPPDPDLIGQLSAVRYKFTSTGKVQVESKEEMKKRGVKSPDLADSLMLSFADEAAVGIHGGKGFEWNKPLKRNLNVV